MKNNLSGKKAKKTFNQYNRTSDIVRCPNGKANTRKLLDSYASAAVNLYGIISREDFVDIFNKQNIDQTTSEEIYILLLPLVLKNGRYGFYKEYIVHYWFFHDFNQVDYLMKHHDDKPRFMPSKNEFLKYVDEDYVDSDHWLNLRRFMLKVFGYSRFTSNGYEQIKNYITYSKEIRELGSILERNNLILDNEEQLEKLMNLITLAKNNTRKWENKGYSPSELYEILYERNKKIVKFPTQNKIHVGRNDFCPCGSGKKYKRCCAIFDDNKTSQLSFEECRLFYEIWYGLMGYVNEKLGILKVKIKPEYPNSVSDMMMLKIRNVLWEKPELIDAYLTETKLSQEKIDILKKWRANHKKGMMFIMEYLPEYAVVISSNEKGEDRLYGIKGISKSLSNIVQRDLPTQIETVLLPFNGKIIYDSFISCMSIGFAEGAKTVFREIYDVAKEHGIITKLE